MEKIRTHGRTLQGEVVSDKAAKTVTVEMKRRVYLKKYERYTKRRTKILAHNPEEIGAKVGDIVQIKETRPISKRKSFIVTKVIDKK